MSFRSGLVLHQPKFSLPHSLQVLIICCLIFSTVQNNPKCRSSLPAVFCKKGVLRNFTKFTGKPSLFFNKVAGLRP